MTERSQDSDLISLYAQIAAKSYNEPGKQNIEGYQVVFSTPHLTADGFQAIAYGILSEDSIHYDEIIIAFRGSMPPENFNLNEFIQDWIINDFGDIVGGSTPTQLSSAINFYNHIKENYLSANGTITLTGHSLGGALVQLVAAKEGVEGYTFNAPGVKFQAEQAQYTYNNVHNYIIMNDIIGNLRDTDSNSSSSGHVGEEYYYFPTKTGSTIGMFNPHGAYTQIDDFSAYVTDINWTFEKSLALFWFDASM